MFERLHPEVVSRLERGTLLVLPTARSAAELRRLYDAQQHLIQRPSWEMANVQSWSQWTQSLWTELILSGKDARLLLNPLQEHSLWTEVIGLSAAPIGLGSPDAMAALSRSGLQRVAAYSATSRLRATAVTEDSRIFSGWVEEFFALCDRRECLSPSVLEVALAAAFHAGTLAPPTALDLAGCSSLLPAQQSLLDTLAQAGTNVTHLPLAEVPERISRSAVSLPTEREELTFAVSWIRNQLEAGTAAGRPRQVALVVPDLSSEHSQIERALRDTLAPELHAIGEDLSSTPWQMGAGTMLSTLPLIAAALDLAQWSAGPLPLPRISVLLLSPYLGYSADRDAAALFDAQGLRCMPLLRPELTLPAALALPSSVPPPQWLRNLHIEHQRAGSLERSRSYADWTEFFRGLARAANWPGDRETNAVEFAAIEAWESALDMVATLDFSGRRVPLAEALRTLTELLQSTASQPLSTGSPVVVLAPSEAEACLFDALLYLRSTDANLPVRPAVHPLLSWQLQRSLNMPGADPAADAEHARRDLDALLTNATTILFTHAQHDDSGALRPSPMLAALQIVASPAAIPAISAPQVELDTWADDSPLPALPATVYGGTRVLKLQGACGFRAFAELRLRAGELDAPELGLDARESGDVLHRTLHGVWKELGTQQALLALDAEQRRALVTRHLDTALERHTAGSAWDEAYLAMHRERTLALLLRWLEIEALRRPFTIAGTEREEKIVVGPLTIKVRVDRVDTVTLDASSEPPRMGTLLIDYKTGSSGTPKDWDSSRPDDPQLPLYALHTHDPKVCGVVFAKVRAGETMTWLGLQDTEGILPLGKKSQIDIDTTISNWYDTLTQLAEEFAAGRATVDPKSYPTTCKYCGQRLLCRVEPATLAALAEETDEETDG